MVDDLCTGCPLKSSKPIKIRKREMLHLESADHKSFAKLLFESCWGYSSCDRDRQEQEFAQDFGSKHVQTEDTAAGRPLECEKFGEMACRDDRCHRWTLQWCLRSILLRMLMQKKLMQKRSIFIFHSRTSGNIWKPGHSLDAHFISFFRSKDIPIAISYKKGVTQVIWKINEEKGELKWSSSDVFPRRKLS